MKHRLVLGLLVAPLVAGCGDKSAEGTAPTASATTPEPPKPKELKLPTFETDAKKPGPVLIGLDGQGTFELSGAEPLKLTSKVAKVITIGGDGIAYADTTGSRGPDEDVVLAKMGVHAAATSKGAVGVVGKDVLRPDASRPRTSEVTPATKTPVKDATSLTLVAVGPSDALAVASRKEVHVQSGETWTKTELSKLAPDGAISLMGLAWAGDKVFAYLDTGVASGKGDIVKSVDGEVTIDVPKNFNALGPQVKNRLYGLPDGRLAILGGERLMVVSADGKTKQTWETKTWVGGEARILDLTVDGQGRIWIASPDAGLLVVDDKGKMLMRWPTSSLPGPPRAIAVAGAGPKLPEKAPEEVKGKVTGTILVNGDPLGNSRFVACYWPRVAFRGPHPCTGEVGAIEGKTKDDGSFELEGLPRGIYNFSPKDPEGWITASRQYTVFAQDADTPHDMGKVQLTVR